MAFCIQCGQTVGERDAFCAACGAAQPGAPAAAPPVGGSKPFDPGIPAATASVLCYAPWFGWLVALVVLIAEVYRRNLTARFHAFQGLFLFIAWQVVDKLLGSVFRHSYMPWPTVGLLKVLLVVASIYMMIATHKGQKVKLPLLGDLAEKAASEQN